MGSSWIGRRFWKSKKQLKHLLVVNYFILFYFILFFLVFGFVTLPHCFN